MTADPVLVGRVIRPHGIRGEVVVEPLSDNPERYAPGTILRLGPGLEEREVASSRPHKGRWLVRFAGVEDRDTAEELRDAELFVDSSELPDLDPDTFWIHDLIGCRVVSADGDDVGEVVDVSGGADGPGDWLEVDGDGDTNLIPMVRDWLVEIDIDEGRIVMQLPEGLLEV